MAGLIPPTLHKEPGTWSSMEPPSIASRRRSCQLQTSPSPEHRGHRRQKSLPSLKSVMRVSMVDPTALVVIPSDALGWRRTIDEVKRKYLARKYRSCSMQCSEILDNLTDTSVVEPLHLIYLHFYAASSFEWCARPLSSSSAYRTKLLCSAQAHYAEAETLIVAAEWNITERARSPSLSTMGLNSPGLSASSKTSDESSTSSSPRTSVFSLDDEPPAKMSQPVRTKAKKKVSFSGLPEFFEFQPEPYIRPDSPTLGWDDYDAMPSNDITTPFSIPSKRLNPISILKPTIEEQESQTPTPTRIDVGFTLTYKSPLSVKPADSTAAAVARDFNQDEDGSNNYNVFDLELFLQTRTLNRVRGQLSALRDQVCRHRAAVDGLLAVPDIPPSTPKTPNEPYNLPETRQSHPSYANNTPLSSPEYQQPVDSNPEHAPPTTEAPKTTSVRPALRIQTDIEEGAGLACTPRYLRRRNSSASPSLYQPTCGGSSEYTYASGTPTDLMTPPLSAGGAGGSIQDRIERLRASGWRRKRFDSRRYEALREQVLGELGPCS